MLIKRAEKAGYSAVLITVDTPRFSKHKGRAGFSLPRHLKFANFVSLQGNWKRGLKSNSEVEIYLKAVTDSSVVWESLDWLRSITSLPIVVKGILTAEDARLAAQHGVQGILVSNHGGRQLDGVQATVCVMTYGFPSSFYNYIGGNLDLA